MHEHLGYHASQKETVQAQRHPEVRPVMSIFHNLQRITLEIDIGVEIHFMERLHGDLALSMILRPITIFVEVQIMLNPTPGQSSFLILARRDSRGNGPEGG